MTGEWSGRCDCTGESFSHSLLDGFYNYRLTGAPLCRPLRFRLFSVPITFPFFALVLSASHTVAYHVLW